MLVPDTEKAVAETVGVIDLGANSARMVIAQISASGGIEVLERTQRAVRLGQDTFVKGRLSQPAMNAAISILRDYKKLLRTYKVENMRTVATSAVREASNRDVFVDRVAMAVDLDLEVLEPTEESLLTVSAVRQAVRDVLDLAHNHALIIEVGGGSTLLTLLENGIIAASESYALGSIRLLEYLAALREPPGRAPDLLRRQIATSVSAIRRAMSLSKVQFCIAVGDDVRFAAQQAGKPAGPQAGSLKPQSLGNLLHRVGLKAFNRLVTDCTRPTPEELSRKYSLPFGSAERLAPALLIYQALLQATSAEEMLVCDVSIRDGLLLNMAHQATGQEDAELAESVVQSAKTIGEKYRYDPVHADRVTKLALRLFDELQKEHRLSPRHRLLLRVAGTLHEIGKFVSSRAHHKHSFYLIVNSEVFSLRREELQVVAAVARYHRRSMPRTTHPEYMTLPREKRIVVNKLAALLRVADALERGRSQEVCDLRIERWPTELCLYVQGVAELALERRALAEKANLFEDTYGMKVRVEEATAPTPDARWAATVDEGDSTTE